jgi:predicted metal-binding membrane protein
MDMGAMDMRGARMISTGWRMVMAPARAPWTPASFVLMALMWAVMMVGMMTPSAAPLVLLYARVGRQSAEAGRPLASAGWFVAGYLAAWTLFSIAATFAQWGLEQAALLTPMMRTASEPLGGAVLVLAGLYQWSTLKASCLAHCRSPLAFLQEHGGFRREAGGAFRLGLHHGVYCVGCCWMLMALLFVGGVMNVLWIAGLAVLVLVEKATPVGRTIARVAGAVLLAAGAWLLLAGLRPVINV